MKLTIISSINKYTGMVSLEYVLKLLRVLKEHDKIHFAGICKELANENGYADKSGISWYLHQLVRLGWIDHEEKRLGKKFNYFLTSSGKSFIANIPFEKLLVLTNKISP
jgi:hypothetical protein